MFQLSKLSEHQNIIHYSKALEGKVVKKLYVPHPEDPVLTFNWVLENQPIASGILKQPSRYKRTKSNLLADKKGL